MSRKRQISEILLGPSPDREGGQDWLVTEITYHLGGLNMFSQRQEPRGYCLGVHQEGRHTRDGHQYRSFAMFGGIRTMILLAARFSESKLDAIQPDPGQVKQLQRELLSRLRVECDKRMAQLQNGASKIAAAERIDAIDKLLDGELT